jgi:hypothetical protein
MEPEMTKDPNAVEFVNWDNLPEEAKIESLHYETNRLSDQLQQLSNKLQHLLNVIHVRADGNLEIRRNLSAVNGADILLE